MSRPIVTLTTDFSLGSPYIAQMKASALCINPELNFIDIAHDIPPQNILHGAIVLDDSCHFFPPGTIHIAVIDPGVGTTRRLIAFESNSHIFIGPDNGVFEYVLRRAAPRAIRELSEHRFWRSSVSSTFHGRDILAPVAAHLSNGIDLEAFGQLLELPQLVRLPVPEPTIAADHITGECVIVDGFGNVISNISDRMLESHREKLSIEIAGRVIEGCVETYGAAADGQLVALIGSNGRLEVAKVNGHAAHELDALPGTPVVVRRTKSDKPPES